MARGHREAPEIDGVVQVPDSLAVGELHDVVVVDALGPDLVAEPAPLAANPWVAAADPVSHDPSAIATWANVVTVTRVMVSPVLFALITGSEGSWVALALWVALCASDGVDGFLARRYGTTRSGAFLDPLADKVLVLGAMFTLVGRGVFPVLPVAIIAMREVVISLYRTFAGAKGVSIPATPVAKLKTRVPAAGGRFRVVPSDRGGRQRLWLTLLWIAVVLTVVSGAHYLLRARRVATERVPVPQSAAG